LNENRDLVKTMFEELAQIGGKMENLRRAFAGEEREDERGSGEVHAARRVLRMALHEKTGCSPEESKRIADILRRAAGEILGKL